MPRLKFKTSSSSGASPANGSLLQGEPAFNTGDGRVYAGNTSGNPTKMVGTAGAQDSNAVNFTGGSISVGSWSNSNVTVGNMNLGGTNISKMAGPNGGDSAAIITSAGAKQLVDDRMRQRLVSVQTFTGNGTYRKSGPEVKRVHVLVCGGGGGARAYSECGGGGGFAEGVFDATGMGDVTVTVGGGSGGGSYFGFSGQGGTTSFGGYISAAGGYGANQNSQHSGGHGGYGYGGQIQTHGGSGGSHNNMDQYSSSNASGGIGGGTYFGGCMAADRPNWGYTTNAAPGTGGVAIAPSHNGQGGRSGNAGICIVYEYK